VKYGESFNPFGIYDGGSLALARKDIPLPKLLDLRSIEFLASFIEGNHWNFHALSLEVNNILLKSRQAEDGRKKRRKKRKHVHDMPHMREHRFLRS